MLARKDSAGPSPGQCVQHEAQEGAEQIPVRRPRAMAGISGNSAVGSGLVNKLTEYCGQISFNKELCPDCRNWVDETHSTELLRCC